MLMKFGFHQKWIDRVIICITSVTYSFVHNEGVFGEVHLHRGIRQGDPMSPYIYILCVEGLSAILRRHEDAGLIHGCRVARGAPVISHLLFADDCYLFHRATEVEATTVKSILGRYEVLSGQSINYNKSSICFSPNTTRENRTLVCSQLGVPETRHAGRYLGMPMYIGKNKREVFGFLEDRVNQKV